MPTLNGEAGEHFVLAEFLRRGWLAGQTPRGYPGFDIVAYHRNDTRPLFVRVKTVRTGQWMFHARGIDLDAEIFRALDRENPSPRDITVLVFMRDGDQPTYHLYRTGGLDRLLRQLHEAYRQTHSPNTVRGIRPDQLGGIAGNWELLDE